MSGAMHHLAGPGGGPRRAPAHFAHRPYTLTELWLAGSAVDTDIVLDPEFTWIAEERLSAELPRSWQKCLDENGDTYFYNIETSETTWSDPNNAVWVDEAMDMRKTFARSEEQARKDAERMQQMRRARARRETLRAAQLGDPPADAAGSQDETVRRRQLQERKQLLVKRAKSLGLMSLMAKAAKNMTSSEDEEAGAAGDGGRLKAPPAPRQKIDIAAYQKLVKSLGIDVEREAGLMYLVGKYLDNQQNTFVSPPWEYHTTEDGSNQVYFYNTETGEVTWDHPTMLSQIQEEVQLARYSMTPSQLRGLQTDRWVALTDNSGKGIMYGDIRNGHVRIKPPPLAKDSAVELQRVARGFVSRQYAKRLKEIEDGKTAHQRMRDMEQRYITQLAREQANAEQKETKAMRRAEHEQCSHGDKYWGIDAFARMIAEKRRLREYRQMAFEDRRSGKWRQFEQFLETQRTETEVLNEIKEAYAAIAERRRLREAVNREQMTREEDMQRGNGDNFWGCDVAEQRRRVAAEEERLRAARAEEAEKRRQRDEQHRVWLKVAEERRHEQVLAEMATEEIVRAHYMDSFFAVNTSKPVMAFEWPTKDKVATDPHAWPEDARGVTSKARELQEQLARRQRPGSATTRGSLATSRSRTLTQATSAARFMQGTDPRDRALDGGGDHTAGNDELHAPVRTFHSLNPLKSAGRRAPQLVQQPKPKDPDYYLAPRGQSAAAGGSVDEMLEDQRKLRNTSLGAMYASLRSSKPKGRGRDGSPKKQRPRTAGAIPAPGGMRRAHAMSMTDVKRREHELVREATAGEYVAYGVHPRSPQRQQRPSTAPGHGSGGASRRASGSVSTQRSATPQRPHTAAAARSGRGDRRASATPKDSKQRPTPGRARRPKSAAPRARARSPRKGAARVESPGAAKAHDPLWQPRHKREKHSGNPSLRDGAPAWNRDGPFITKTTSKQTLVAHRVGMETGKSFSSRNLLALAEIEEKKQSRMHKRAALARVRALEESRPEIEDEHHRSVELRTPAPAARGGVPRPMTAPASPVRASGARGGGLSAARSRGRRRRPRTAAATRSPVRTRRPRSAGPSSGARGLPDYVFEDGDRVWPAPIDELRVLSQISCRGFVFVEEEAAPEGVGVDASVVDDGPRGARRVSASASSAARQPATPGRQDPADAGYKTPGRTAMGAPAGQGDDEEDEKLAKFLDVDAVMGRARPRTPTPPPTPEPELPPQPPITRYFAAVWRSSLMYLFERESSYHDFFHGADSVNAAAGYLDLECVISVRPCERRLEPGDMDVTKLRTKVFDPKTSTKTDTQKAAEANMAAMRVRAAQGDVEAVLALAEAEGEAAEKQKAKEGQSDDSRSDAGSQATEGRSLYGEMSEDEDDRTVLHGFELVTADRTWRIYPDWHQSRYELTDKHNAFVAEVARLRVETAVKQVDAERKERIATAAAKRGVREGNYKLKVAAQGARSALQMLQKNLAKAEADAEAALADVKNAHKLTVKMWTNVLRPSIRKRVAQLRQLTGDFELDADASSINPDHLMPVTRRLLAALYKAKSRSWTVPGPEMEMVRKLRHRDDNSSVIPKFDPLLEVLGAPKSGGIAGRRRSSVAGAPLEPRYALSERVMEVLAKGVADFNVGGWAHYGTGADGKGGGGGSPIVKSTELVERQKKDEEERKRRAAAGQKVERGLQRGRVIQLKGTFGFVRPIGDRSGDQEIYFRMDDASARELHLNDEVTYDTVRDERGATSRDLRAIHIDVVEAPNFSHAEEWQTVVIREEDAGKQDMKHPHPPLYILPAEIDPSQLDDALAQAAEKKRAEDSATKRFSSGAGLGAFSVGGGGGGLGAMLKAAAKKR